MLWVAEDRLASATKLAIVEADAVYVSAVSIWEIEIKRAAGRLKAPADLGERVDASGYDRLEITFEHAAAAGRLPPLHADPFGRMLVAQARLEGLALATADAAIRQYAVTVAEAASG